MKPLLLLPLLLTACAHHPAPEARPVVSTAPIATSVAQASQHVDAGKSHAEQALADSKQADLKENLYQLWIEKHHK